MMKELKLHWKKKQGLEKENLDKSKRTNSF